MYRVEFAIVDEDGNEQFKPSGLLYHKDMAMAIAEDKWNRWGVHTRVINDETDECEFEYEV